MRVMRAEEEQHDWHAEQKLLGGCVLSPIVDLFPHVQVIKSTAVELEWHAANVMKHDVGSKHVRDVRQSPGCLL